MMKIRETTAQVIFRKYNELRWLDFVEWLEGAKEELLNHNKHQLIMAHTQGSRNDESSEDYYERKYGMYLNKLFGSRTYVNKVWLTRLYYDGQIIGDFPNFEQAIDYAYDNYDRATDTIKAYKRA